MSYDIPYLATYNEVLDDLYCKTPTQCFVEV